MPDPMDLPNRPKMYRIRPYFEIKKVKLPACMYLIKPVHQLTNISPNSSSEEATSSALSYVEKRQEWLLSQINKLQEKVKVLADNLGVGPAEVGILQQQETASTRDVVISCPTTSPPYILRALYHYISGCVPTAYRVHVHSSATTLATDNLRNFLNCLPSDPKPILRVVLIWKSDSECKLPTLLVSPHNQTPVEGVANISRYLCREYFPALYEEGPGGAESASQVDSWLDLFSASLERGSAKEKSAVLRRLNSQLGSAQYLVGTQISVADMVGFCAVSGQPNLKLPGNVKQWLKRLKMTVPGLKCVPCSYIITSDES